MFTKKGNIEIHIEIYTFMSLTLLEQGLLLTKQKFA